MLIWKKSVPGTVREENQDTVVIHQDQGILILADGSGSAGKQAGQLCADSLAARLQKIRQQASIENSSERIMGALRETCDQQNDQPGSPTSNASLAFACLVEGRLFLGGSGKVGIVAQAGENTITISPRNRQILQGTTADSPPSDKMTYGSLSPEMKVEGPFPLHPEDWILAATEGILLSQPFSEMEPFFPGMREDAEQTAEMLFQKATAGYDGDDRTLVLVRFQACDLRCLLGEDVTIETSFDRVLTIPMWAAGAICILIGALGIFLHRIGLLDLGEE